MWVKSLHACLLALLLCSAAGGARAADDIAELIRQADGLRSSDSAAFDKLRARIHTEIDRATPLQVEQLAYLDAYAGAYAGRYDEVIANLERLATQARDPVTRYRASALLVNSYAVTRQFGEGLRAVEKLLPQIDSASDRDLRSHGLVVVAVMYNQVGQYKLALHYAERALGGAISPRSRCFMGQARLEALQNLKELPSDDSQFIALIDECKLQHEAIIANMVRGHLARKWANEGELRRAIALLQSHMPEVLQTRYSNLIGQVRSQLAELLLQDGQKDAAQFNATEAVARRADMKYSIYLVSAYKTLYALAAQRNDPVAALALYQQYAQADKAYLNEIKTRELAFQIVRQEMLQKTQEIELLNRQKEVLELQRRVDAQSAQVTRVMIGMLLLVLGVIGYWIYKIKRVQRTLRRWAETDALTGICNRHHFTVLSEQSLAQCARSGETAALVMFDLDHFKSVNDRFGHVTGDWVLKQVAEVCQGFCRRVDHLGRLGGEEFALLMHSCDLRDAARMANDVRVRIAAIDTTETGYQFTVTASFGVTATSLSGYDLARLLSHADQMLYRAKREGRNRVCAYDGEPQVFKDQATLRPDGSDPNEHSDVPLSA